MKLVIIPRFGKMFMLSKLRSLVRLEPWGFDRPLPEALSDALNAKLANKVLKDVGLVIALFDILEIGDSFIFPGDGSSHTRVTFRLLVFRPFVEEVLVGKIKGCTKEGVTISLGFFDDIIVPPEALQHPCRFDESDQVWVWEYPTEEGDHHDLYMDPGEEVRFRVTSETFVDCSPTMAPGAAAKDPAGAAGDDGDDADEKRVPYQLRASVNEPGLGLLSWWKS